MMSEAIPWLRHLCDEILDYSRHALFYDVLTPWIDKAQPAIAELRRFSAATSYDRDDVATQDAMWNLYALSRVNDLLLTTFQDVGASSYSGPQISPDEYASFYSGLGFAIVESNSFSPFRHEIVRVHQSPETDEPIGMLDCRWPGVMFGELMFSRSGVEVIGGRSHILKEVAEQSTLYFTHRRRFRKTSDLSRGWGSNSQWRTSFRCDYQSKGTWIYNFHGKTLLNTAKDSENRDGLTTGERIELCRNRCFVMTTKEDSDLWPFDDRYEEPSYA